MLWRGAYEHVYVQDVYNIFVLDYSAIRIQVQYSSIPVRFDRANFDLGISG